MGMKLKTVVLYGQNTLMSSSIESVLVAQKKWHVINVSSDDGIQVLTSTIRSVYPDIVIVFQGDQATPKSLLMQLLTDQKGLKVIAINLEENSMEVYTKQQVLVTDAADLFLAVENDFTDTSSLSTEEKVG